MSKTREEIKSNQKFFRRMNLFFCLIALILLVIFAFIRRNELIVEQKNQFHAELDRTRLAIHNFVSSYVHGLQGVGGLYVVKSHYVSPAEFENYARFRNFFDNFPGSLGYGFIRRVTNKTEYLNKMAKLNPQLHFKQINQVEGKDYYIIEAIEPLKPSAKALGLDIGSEQERRKTANQAMESGLPSITSPVKLIQLKTEHIGFLFYLPIYSTVTVPATVEERCEKLIGWAYAPIVSDRLFEHLAKTLSSNLKFEIYELSDQGQKIFIYRNFEEFSIDQDMKKEVATRSISFGGKNWILQSYPSHILDQRTLFWYPIGIFVLGFLFLIGIYFMVRRVLLISLKNILYAERAENWQRAVLASTSYSIISTTPEGIITLFNARAEEMLGYKSSELIGRETPRIIHDPNEVLSRSLDLSKELGRTVEPGFETFIAKALAAGSDTVEWTYIRKDQSRFPVKLCVTPILNSEGLLEGFLGVAEDLTNQKEIEKSLVKNRSQLLMASKMSALGEMASGVAHEINNPLSIISMRVQKIKIQLEKDVSLTKLEIQEELGKILSTVHRIAQIISGLRKFSRNAEDDAMEIVPFSKIIEETIDLCAEKFKQNNIPLVFEIQATQSTRCRPVQISQVIMNLITNSFDAVKAMDPKFVRLELDSDTQFMNLRITDSGKGIEKEHLDKIFQPFFTTKPVGAGTGLGLSISLGIIQDHGGTLKYETHQGHTSFILSLPIDNSN